MYSCLAKYKFLSIPTEYEGLPPQRCSSPNSFPFFQIFSVRGRVRGKASDWRARRSLLLDTSLFWEYNPFSVIRISLSFGHSVEHMFMVLDIIFIYFRLVTLICSDLPWMNGMVINYDVNHVIVELMSWNPRCTGFWGETSNNTIKVDIKKQ